MKVLFDFHKRKSKLSLSQQVDLNFLNMTLEITNIVFAPKSNDTFKNFLKDLSWDNKEIAKIRFAKIVKMKKAWKTKESIISEMCAEEIRAEKNFQEGLKSGYISKKNKMMATSNARQFA